MSPDFVPRCIKEDNEVFKFFNSEGVELSGNAELQPEPDDQASGEGSNAEEPDSCQPTLLAPPSSSYSLMSLEKLDLPTIVEEDPLMMNKELCEVSEQPVVIEPSLGPTAGTSFDDTNDPPPHLPLVS